MPFAPTFNRIFQKVGEIFRRKKKAAPIVPQVHRYHVEEKPLPSEPATFKMTKAYADQRQKARRNRRRKPSKAMRHLYQLG